MIIAVYAFAAIGLVCVTCVIVFAVLVVIAVRDEDQGRRQARNETALRRALRAVDGIPVRQPEPGTYLAEVEQRLKDGEGRG